MLNSKTKTKNIRNDVVLHPPSLKSVDSIAKKTHKLLAQRKRTLSAKQKKQQAKTIERKVNEAKKEQHLYHQAATNLQVVGWTI